MHLQHSPRADALYVEFSDKLVAYTEDISRGEEYTRGVDYDFDGEPVGVEFLGVSRGVDLTDVPHADQITRLLREHKIRELA